MQKVCFQLFGFLTDFNFDYRFLEGMTGAIFVIWFGEYGRHFVFMFVTSWQLNPAYWHSDLLVFRGVT